MKFKKHKIKLNNNTYINGYIMDLELYGCVVELSFGQVEKLEKWNTNMKNDGFVHTDKENKSGVYWIHINNINDVGVIIHELYHLVNFIAKFVGLSDDTSNEQQAYLIEFLFTKVLDVIKKTKNKKTL